MNRTLFRKVWEEHTVRQLPSGQTQLFIGLHLVHEVTSPQAFQMLRDRGLKVRFPGRTFATVDHIVPTDALARPYQDALAVQMLVAIERNAAEFGVPLFGTDDGRQGIVHVIGPELGLTQPGMTIACGDSHTATHGALGAVAFGIGTSQVRDVLATQCLAMSPLKVRRIEVEGALGRGVYAKDVILHIIGRLGVEGGVGYAYEYGGAAVAAMSLEERMTLCNMSIEGGARVGYVNPDATTYAWLRGRAHAPRGEAFDRAVAWWSGMASDAGAGYDDTAVFAAGAVTPTVTWGTNPGQSCGIEAHIPAPVHLLFHLGRRHSGEAHEDRLIAHVVFAREELKQVANDLFLLRIENPQIVNPIQGGEAFLHLVHLILGLDFHLEHFREEEVVEVLSFAQKPPDQPIRIRLEQPSHPVARLPEIQPVFFPQLEIEKKSPLL